MRIMRPRTGFALVAGALLVAGVTSIATAAQHQAPQPVCYSACPANVDLEETFHVLHVGAEQIEVFSVMVQPAVGGATAAPTGAVAVKAGSTALCTITLAPVSNGRGSCSPSANALPAGHYVVIASYSGDSTYSPAQSHARQLEIIRGPGGGGD